MASSRRSFDADYLFRGVIVPGGTSTVEFVYEPASFRIGGGISIAALVVALVIIVGSRRRRRSDPDTVRRKHSR